MNEPNPESTSGHPQTFEPKFWRLIETIKIALLEGVENDIKTGMLPSLHLAAFESLARAMS